MTGRPFLAFFSISVLARVGLLLAVMVLMVPASIFGQGHIGESPADPGPWVPPLRDLKQNAVELATAPFNFSSAEHRLAVGAVGLLIGITATLDEPTYIHFSERSASSSGDGTRRATASLVAPGVWYDERDANRLALQAVGTLAVSGIVFRKPALTRTSVRTLEAIVYTDLATGILKSLLNRSRPYVGDEPDAFGAKPGSFSSDHTELAMPSGHAGRVFAIASTLAHESDRWYLAVPLYVGATSVGLERVQSGDHWLTDVLVGATFGYFIGRTVSGSRRSQSLSAQRISYAPLLTMDRFGVAVLF